MKCFGFWVLLFMVGTALMCLCFSSKTVASSAPDMAFIQREKDTTVTATSRKLKVHGYMHSTGEFFESGQDDGYKRRNDKGAAGDMNLEDYRRIDPVPSSKASIHPRPIQHGTPLMPYIPKPSPPGTGRPKRGGSP